MINNGIPFGKWWVVVFWYFIINKAQAVGNYVFSWPLAKTKTAIDRIFSEVTTMGVLIKPVKEKHFVSFWRIDGINYMYQD